MKFSVNNWFARAKISIMHASDDEQGINKLLPYLGWKGRNIAFGKTCVSVKKGIFPFLGARIWVPIPVYWYKNPGYIIG